MLRERLRSFKYAFAGIRTLFQTQPNARIHFALATLAIAAGLFFSLGPSEWILLVLTISLVLATEAINTAIEHLTDLLSPQYHELAGKAKDLAAGAVLLVAFGAFLTGILLFLPKIVKWLW